MKTIRYILALSVMLAYAYSALSQVTATGHISVTIVSPISITKIQDMNFGHVSVESGMGTVTLSPENQSRYASGAVELVDGGDVSLASFQVKGYEGATFSITLPESPVMISNGGKNMMVSNFTSTPTSAGELSNGSNMVLVGATLELSGDQSLGLYASSNPFPVTVNYN